MITQYFNAWTTRSIPPQYYPDTGTTDISSFNNVNNEVMSQANEVATTWGGNYKTEKISYTYNDRSLRIILSIATGVDTNRIYLYMASFRKYHPNADIYKLYLFTDFDDQSHYPEYERLAKEFQVDLIDVKPLEESLDAKYQEMLNKRMKYVRINKRRFFYLYEWLSETYLLKDKVELIMICDTNDVIFQV